MLRPMESPKYRPLERFWPYEDLPEQPTAEELAALDPDLRLKVVRRMYAMRFGEEPPARRSVE